MASENSTPVRVLPDQAARDLIRTELRRNIIVEAAAGTGKTASMTARMVELLATGACPDIAGLAAVTFTRKAAAELRGRFRLALEQAAREGSGRDAGQRDRLAAALAGLDRCYIGTIHSFCARLLRERPVEAGIDSGFAELDELDDLRLMDESFDEFVNRLHADDGGGLLAALLDEGLNPLDLKRGFRAFANYPDVDEWPLPELAPGTDTDEKIKEVSEYVDHMLQLGERLPTTCGTDSLVPQYRIIPRLVRVRGGLAPLPKCEPVLNRLCRKAEVKKTLWPKSGALTAQDALAEQERWDQFQKRVARPLLDELLRRRYPLALRVMLGARDIYDQRRRQLGALNFQDLLLRARDLLRHPDHRHVRASFSRRYTQLLVDEFQDTDPIQAEVMLLLTADDPAQTNWRQCRPRPGSLFVVGDPKQSIYRFRRADIVTYNEVRRILLLGSGDAAGLELQLQANFRAAPSIIDAVNKMFRPDGAGAAAELVRFPDAPTPQSPAYVPLQAGRDEAGAGEFCGVFRLTGPDDTGDQDRVAQADAESIARFIRRAVDTGILLPRTQRERDEGRPAAAAWGDFMIVTHRKKRLNVYAQALARYGIPHQVTGGSALAQVTELKLLRLALAAVAHPDNPVMLLAALRSELFGVSDRDLYALKKGGGRFDFRAAPPAGLGQPAAGRIGAAFAKLSAYAGWFEVMPAAAALEHVAGDLGLPALCAAREGGNDRAGGMLKAIELARAAERECWSPAQLADYVGALAEAEETHDSVPARPPEESVVRVMNLHKVKGLEAPVVFLADPSGNSPHAPGIHIDRGADRAQGYIVFEKETTGWRSSNSTLARPGDWENLSEREKEFQRAEELRLRYVAATRAGAALIVSFRAGKNQVNPWRQLEPFAVQPLPDPGPVSAPAVDEAVIGPAEPTAAAAAIADRLARSGRPTRRLASARQFALGEAPAAAPAAGPTVDESVEHGLAWGALLHSLLETAMARPGADLESLAVALAQEQELPAKVGRAAAEAVAGIIRSEIWRRAQKSPERYTELPFEIMKDTAEGPVLVRGALDLIFKEGDGWVLIDYKTDLLNRRKASDLAALYRPQLQLYAEAFSRLTGGKVIKAGFYFLREDRTEWVGIGKE